MSWNGFAAPVSLTPITTAWAITNLGDNLVDHQARIVNLESGVGGLAIVPSGFGGWVRTAAEIPSGYSRETNLDGRIPIGAGTTFSSTFVEATNYGSTWVHAHFNGSHGHGHGLTFSGSGTNTSGPSSVNTTGGTGNTSADGGHTHPYTPSGSIGGSITAEPGNTDSTSAVAIWANMALRAVVWVRKS